MHVLMTYVFYFSIFRTFEIKYQYYIYRPSLTNDEITDHSDYEYYRAEKLGKEGAPCEHVFNECETSILDKFTGVYTPMMDLFNRIIS